jgi:hypothetical protein
MNPPFVPGTRQGSPLLSIMLAGGRSEGLSLAHFVTSLQECWR